MNAENAIHREKTMPTEMIKINIPITWKRLKNTSGAPYRWGDGKSHVTDSNWSKLNVIYRWVKNSTGETAEIGETERRLTERVNNYISASPGSSAGPTNKKVFNEQQRLSQKNDYLYLEFAEDVSGYNLNDNRERKLAESLLIGYYKPYLQ